MLPGSKEPSTAEEEGHLRHGECDEAEAHQDSTDHADEEGEVIPSPDTLIEPLAVVVKHVDALVTDGAVLGPHGGDVDVAQVAPEVQHVRTPISCLV